MEGARRALPQGVHGESESAQRPGDRCQPWHRLGAGAAAAGESARPAAMDLRLQPRARRGTRADITDLSSIKEAATVVQTHLKGAGLNLLINNAAIYTETSLETTGFDDMISVYTTNVVGPLMAFLPLLRKAAHNSNQKGLSCSKAALINISSSLGSIELVPQTYIKAVIPYRCSKAALNMLTKCEALSYKEEGILCSAVHPGWVKTDMGTQQADLTVEESVQGILEVLSRLNDEHSGAFVNWKGKKLPW